MFDVEINIHVELKIVIFEYHSFVDIFKKFVFENRFEMTNHEKKNMKKENLKMFYIIEIIFELKIIHFATTTMNKMIIETFATCLINK